MRIAVLLATALLATPALADHGHGGDQASTTQMQHKEHCGHPAGEGTVVALDVAKRRVTIAHEAIDNLGWPKAETEIVVDKSVDLAAFAAGDRVHFLMAQDKKKKQTLIAAMCSTEADGAAHEACMTAMHKTAMERASETGQECKGMDHDAHEGHGAKPNEDHGGHH